MNEGVAHRSNGETNFNGSAERASKNYGGSWFAIGSPGQTNVGQKVPGISWSGSDKPGYKPAGLNVTAAQRYRQERDDFGWDKSTPLRNNNSKSDSRKAASAQIAKIPLPLSRWIARCYLPAA